MGVMDRDYLQGALPALGGIVQLSLRAVQL